MTSGASEGPPGTSVSGDRSLVSYQGRRVHHHEMSLSKMAWSRTILPVLIDLALDALLPHVGTEPAGARLQWPLLPTTVSSIGRQIDGQEYEHEQ